MNNWNENIQGLKGVSDLIKIVAEAHPALNFKSGPEADFAVGDYAYPLAYLETEFNSSLDVETNGVRYSINLLVADKLNDNSDEEEVIKCMAKTEQMLSEVHAELEEYFPSVSDLSIATFRDHSVDGVIVSRGEFDVVIRRHTSQLATPYDGFTIDFGGCKPVQICDPLAENPNVIVEAGGVYTCTIPDYLDRVTDVTLSGSSLTFTMSTEDPINIDLSNVISDIITETVPAKTRVPLVMSGSPVSMNLGLSYNAFGTLISSFTIRLDNIGDGSTGTIDLYNTNGLAMSFATSCTDETGASILITNRVGGKTTDQTLYLLPTGAISQCTAAFKRSGTQIIWNITQN